MKFKKGHVVLKEWREKISKTEKGRIFSKETRKKISKAKMGHIVSKETREKIGKGNGTPVGVMPKNIQVPGKFGNIKRGWYDILGIRMFLRSKWEVNYALYLNFLIKQKQILKWEYEPDVFVFEKIKFGTRSYRPDFKVFNTDSTIEYHEVKGYMDARSKTKIKRMAKYYPEIKLIIIDKSIYRDILKKLGKMLKFYE